MKTFKKIMFTAVAVPFILSVCSCEFFSGLFASNKKPVVKYDRTESLEKLFNPDSLGTTTITLTRYNWDDMLSFYDKYSGNAKYVEATFKYEKDGVVYDSYTDKTGTEHKFDKAGLRIRGNTSRTRPQNLDGKYQQAHFKICLDFNDSDAKLIGAVEGFNYKRFKNDPRYVNEVFSYNFFRNAGIWTSPRACYTRIIIRIDEDKKEETKRNDKGEVLPESVMNELTDNFTEIDYGVYCMVEEVNKQFLAERKGTNKLSKKGGDLWKCSWKKSRNPETGEWESESPASLEKEALDEKDIIGVSNKSGEGLKDDDTELYNYDLKTNRQSADTESRTQDQAIQAFKKWVISLDNIIDENEARQWYSKYMDPDLFIKTYAASVILGNWDDYWINANNYYLYYDYNDETDSGKTYFIPFDYDNSMDKKIHVNTYPMTRNPVEWGFAANPDKTRPLIDKLFMVPEYKALYKKYLIELGNSSYIKNASSKISQWQSMIKGAISHSSSNPDFIYSATVDPKNTGSDTVGIDGFIEESNDKYYQDFFTQKLEQIQIWANDAEPLKPYVYNEEENSLTFYFQPESYNYEDWRKIDYNENTKIYLDFDNYSYIDWEYLTDEDGNPIWNDETQAYERKYTYLMKWNPKLHAFELKLDDLSKYPSESTFCFYQQLSQLWWGYSNMSKEFKTKHNVKGDNDYGENPKRKQGSFYLSY